MTLLRALLLSLLLPSAALAAATGGGGTGWAEVFRMLAGLGIVLGILFLLYAVVRRGFGPIPGARDSQLKIVEMRHLGPRKSLCLVEVRGKEFLLGVASERIDLLCRLEPGERTSFDETLRAKSEKSG